MKSNPKLLDTLNGLLADELTATNQYMVHAEMAENWGYDRLKKTVRGRAIVEMKHAEKLIERILFLEGTPIVSNLNQIRIGSDIPAQLGNDLGLEMSAVKNYNAAIKLAVELGDNATKDILEGILRQEDGHVDEIEERLDQISQMGLQNFLTTQTDDK
jgi:bacterioferritin